MDDFQNTSQDDVVDDNIDPSVSTPETENTETPDTENVDGQENSQEQQVTFDEKQQAKVEELIGAKVAKTHEERRRADALAAENEALKAKVPAPVIPVVPELPNVNDFYGNPDGYNKALMDRDQAVQKRAEYDAQQRYIEDQNRQSTQRADFEQAQRQQASIDTYTETAKSFGIDAEQMQKDAQKVMQVGIAKELSDHIVSDPQGALIANYLAKNVLELDKVAQMSPMGAAVYIANEVKPKLASVKKSSNAPAPTKVVGGGGAPDKDPASKKGAKFE